MLHIILGAIMTGILRPLLALLDTIQFLVGLLFALLPAAFVVATRGTRPLTTLDQLFAFLSQFPCGATLFSLMVGIATPYTASVRPRFLKVGKEECQARLQDRPWLRNPFASLHAIAMANLAEATAMVGILAAAQYEKGLRAIPVKVECEYHKKGRGPITATAKYAFPADKKDAVVPYTALLHDKKGELVCSVVVHVRLSYKHNASEKKVS